MFIATLIHRTFNVWSHLFLNIVIYTMVLTWTYVINREISQKRWNPKKKTIIMLRLQKQSERIYLKKKKNYKYKLWYS